MKKTPARLILSILVGLACARGAGAIELSLEENRAQRGNIGFVDMPRLFKIFPETQKAKESFEESVRQAEEQINLRKAEVLRLRAELDSLKVERAVLAASTPTAPAPRLEPAPPPAESAPALTAAPETAPVAVASAPAVAAAPAAEAAPAASTQTAPALPHPGLAGLPGFAPAEPQEPPAEPPVIINLPGAPAETAAAPAPQEEPPQAVAVVPAPPVEPAPPADPLFALDEKISAKTAELARKESEAREQQAAAEKTLLDLEARKSEILLGKLYRAVQEVARREGVSVVVDRGAILYGHNAVDLTEKVLAYVKGG